MYPVTTIGEAVSIGCTPDGRGCMPVDPPEPSLVRTLLTPIDVPVLGRVVPRDALAGAAVGFVLGAIVVLVAKR